MKTKLYTFLILLVLTAALPRYANGQCASTLSDAGPDGTTLHAWTILTDNYTSSASGCGPGGWGYFEHTYRMSLTITSPTGRVSLPGTGGGSQTVGASGTASVSTAIDTFGEAGLFSLNILAFIDCSVAGPSYWSSSSGQSYYHYPNSFLEEVQGALLSYSSIDPLTGNINNAMLTPEAYEYLVSNGFVAAATMATPVLITVPGVGQVVIAIVVIYIGVKAVQALKPWFEARGHQDPAPIQAIRGQERAGSRDANGNCDPSVSPPHFKWQQQSKSPSNPNRSVHWHWTEWNLNVQQCIWRWVRREGPSDPGPNYILIPGIW